MASFKLTRGSGSRERGGCWMAWFQAFEGNPTWGDQPECVPPTVRSLCIALNDALEDGEREDVIGDPDVFFLPASAENTLKAEVERARICVRAAERGAALLGGQFEGWYYNICRNFDKLEHTICKIPGLFEADRRWAQISGTPGLFEALVAQAWRFADLIAQSIGSFFAHEQRLRLELLPLIKECCAVGKPVARPTLEQALERCPTDWCRAVAKEVIR